MAVKNIDGIRLWMRSLCDVLKATFWVIARNPLRLPFLGAGAWVWVELARRILEAYLVPVDDSSAHPVGVAAFFGWGGVLLAGTLTAPLANGAVIAAVSEYTLQGTMGMGRALRTAWGRASALIGASLLVLAGAIGIALVTGLLFGAVRLTVPVQGAWRMFWICAVALSGVSALFYWLVRCTFVAQAVVLEGCCAQASLDRSRVLVTGNWGRVLGTLIALGLVSWGVAVLLLTAPVVGQVVGQALATPIHVVGTTLLYAELCAEREGQNRGVLVKAQA